MKYVTLFTILIAHVTTSLISGPGPEPPIATFDHSKSFHQMTGAGEISGQVIDTLANEPLPFANVWVMAGGRMVSTMANENGFYTLKLLDPGKYDLHVSFVNYSEFVIPGVVVNVNDVTWVPVKLSPNVSDPIVILPDWEEPVIFPGHIRPIQATEIEYSPVGVTELIAVSHAGVYHEDGSDELHFQGSRSDATQIQVDGIRLQGPIDLPKTAIQEISVYSGGVPAKYGDCTGGIIVITTKSFFNN